MTALDEFDDPDGDHGSPADVRALRPVPSPGPSLWAKGGTWLDECPDTVPAVWGDESLGDVLWAQGEPLMICGPAGVGKSTIEAQLLMARTGAIPGRVLGYDVATTPGRVVLMAMDRPEQIRRCIRRLYRPHMRELLDERLIVWKGPPLHSVARDPAVLLMMTQEALDGDTAGSTLFLDSLKDVAPGIASDEVGAAVNTAIQLCIAAGTDVASLHHLRKAEGKARDKAPTSMEDIYGSTWLTAGVGSVLSVWGQAGASTVELTHLKQPANVVGPLTVEHDHEAGTSSTATRWDLLTWLRSQPRPSTVVQITRAKLGREPSRSECTTVTRHLRKLEVSQPPLAVRVKAAKATDGDLWSAATGVGS